MKVRGRQPWPRSTSRRTTPYPRGRHRTRRWSPRSPRSNRRPRARCVPGLARSRRSGSPALHAARRSTPTKARSSSSSRTSARTTRRVAASGPARRRHRRHPHPARSSSAASGCGGRRVPSRPDRVPSLHRGPPDVVGPAGSTRHPRRSRRGGSGPDPDFPYLGVTVTASAWDPGDGRATWTLFREREN